MGLEKEDLIMIMGYIFLILIIMLTANNGYAEKNAIVVRTPKSHEQQT